jgi:hypothetical protein
LKMLMDKARAKVQAHGREVAPAVSATVSAGPEATPANSPHGDL